jgi:hypothetical protein
VESVLRRQRKQLDDGRSLAQTPRSIFNDTSPDVDTELPQELNSQFSALGIPVPV